MKIPRVLLRSTLYATSTFYMKGISLFMVPFVVSKLQADEFGRLEYITTFAALFSVVVSFGLEDTLYRFSGKQKSKASAAKFSASIYALTMLVSLIFVVSTSSLVFIFGENINTNISTYIWSLLIITLSLEGIISIPLGWMRMKDDFKRYCGVNIFRATLQALLILYFLALGRGVNGVFEAGCISTALTSIVCFTYQYSSTGIKFKKKQFKLYLLYALPIVISGFLAFTLNGVDKWILAGSSNFETLAIYGITGKFAVALIIAMQPYGMWWSPIRFSLAHSSNNGHLQVSKYATYGLIQIALLSILIGILAPVAIMSLFSEDFFVCLQYIAPLLAVFAIKESAEYLNIGCYATNSTSNQMKITLASVITGSFLMIILTPNYGLLGLIFSLFIAQGLRTLALFYYSQRIIHMSVPYYRIASLYIFSFATIAINNQFYFNVIRENSIDNFIFKYAIAWLAILPIIFILTAVYFKELINLDNITRQFRVKRINKSCYNERAAQ